MTEKEFINSFLTNIQIDENCQSCLKIALRDARLITGRNPETGIHELNILENTHGYLNPYSFIGIINYLLILDMIGAIFKSIDVEINKKKKNNIYKAIKYFSNSLSENEIYAIIALRNSLAHNYGLVNIPSSSKEESIKQHKFIIINSKASKIVELPNRKWSSHEDISEESHTKIGHIEFIDFVESIYLNLIEKNHKKLLRISLTNGINELKSRFTINY